MPRVFIASDIVMIFFCPCVFLQNLVWFYFCRSGGKLRPISIQSVLISGGIDGTTAAKLAIFHKALTLCGVSPTDVVRAMLMQSVLINDGISPENILSAVLSMVPTGLFSFSSF